MSTDAYGELAFAILIWDKAETEGLRHEQTKASLRLHELAEALREAGYGLKGKRDESP